MKFVTKGQWSLTVLDNMIMFELECMIVSLQDWINNSDCEQRTDQLCLKVSSMRTHNFMAIQAWSFSN